MPSFKVWLTMALMVIVVMIVVNKVPQLKAMVS